MKEKLTEEELKKHKCKFTYRGIDVEIAPFTDNACTEIHDYGAIFYKDGARLLVVRSGWNCLIYGTLAGCMEKSKKFIDAMIDKNITRVDDFNEYD